LHGFSFTATQSGKKQPNAQKMKHFVLICSRHNAVF
jgi:uncharacterized protein YifE (UPF0438 family)